MNRRTDKMTLQELEGSESRLSYEDTEKKYIRIITTDSHESESIAEFKRALKDLANRKHSS